MKKLIFLLLTGFIIFGFQAKYSGVPKFYHTLLDSAMAKAGANSAELQKALAEAPKEQKEGMAYLISYMPKRDLTTLSAAFLLENTDLAYKARAKYKWCAELPDSVFFNEVLPYASISETRDAWRKDYFERFAKYADGQPSMVDAFLPSPEKSTRKWKWNTTPNARKLI